MIAILFVLGLVVGSFLAAYTYRLPRELSIVKGRSFCDSCRHQLAWYENIPFFSYVFLRGRCRSCHRKISPRYPVIEVTTGIFFTLVPSFFYLSQHQISFLPFSLIFVILFYSLAITIVDVEHQIIPDELIWIPLSIVLIYFFLFSGVDFYIRSLAGFASALFLLILNLATFGRGMGLGDVKYAIFPGFILGFPLCIIWLFTSFFLGATIGVLMLLAKQVKLKQKIAFGPFLVIGFWIILLYGNALQRIIFPYLL